MVRTVLETVGAGSIASVAWPETYINVETGDYVTDIRKICGATAWRPAVSLADGIRATYEYYLRHRAHYW
jgi:nucleoside-diphosphate-sugar epimerase